jgi:hypothetical protein
VQAGFCLAKCVLLFLSAYADTTFGSLGNPRLSIQFGQKRSVGMEQQIEDELARQLEANPSHRLVSYSEKIEYPNGVITQRTLDKDDLRGC